MLRTCSIALFPFWRFDAKGGEGVLVGISPWDLHGLDTTLPFIIPHWELVSIFICHLLCWTHLLFLYVRTMLFMCGLRHMFLLWMSKDFGIHDIGILGIWYGWDVIYSCSMVWHLHLNLYFIMSHWYANVYMCCNCLHSYVRGDYYLMCAFAFKRKLLLCTHLGKIGKNVIFCNYSSNFDRPAHPYGHQILVAQPMEGCNRVLGSH